ncbi:unnamed protein product [Lampetra planeri]
MSRTTEEEYEEELSRNLPVSSQKTRRRHPERRQRGAHSTSLKARSRATRAPGECFNDASSRPSRHLVRVVVSFACAERATAPG